MSATLAPERLARLLDHTLLKPEATEADVRRLCTEAREHGFYSVCVNPVFVRLCAEALKGSAVLPITVVGFPLGANTPSAKAFEAARAVADGAREVDMVIALGALKSGDLTAVGSDISGVVKASGVPVKVIIETALLSDEEKKIACGISAEAGAAFVKTSTGFANGGALVADVRLMRGAIPAGVGVKASGGIRTLDDALELIDAGADRIGASASVAILAEAKARRGRA